MTNDTYTSPLASRNASPEMLRLWSPRHKFNTWRRIWLAVAEAQHEVTKDWPQTKGQPPLVTREQVAELRAVVERGISDEEIARASELERELRHDVMAHVHCLGEQCPKARAIIHLGCTSQDVVCNADLLILDEAIATVAAKVVRIMSDLGEESERLIELPTLGFTHYQAAQPTSVGRRLAHWGYDLYLSATRLFYAADLPAGASPVLRGFRGATGTQASFLALFDQNQDLVDQFETQAIARLLGDEADFAPEQAAARRDAIADQMRANPGFEQMADDYASQSIENYMWHQGREYRFRVTPLITGQTYSRVLDAHVLADLASVAAVLHKIATDIRLLSNRKELDEPFGTNQIGSSAMPYKRNPMKCERICGLARFVMNLVGNAYDTAATQWLERTLDDSSNRRLSLPEAFLALDGALDLMHEVASGLVVHEAMVRKNLMAELPFLATENILMEAVKAGGDRQEYHEIIRAHAQAAGMRVKHEGLDNDLLDRLQSDKAFWSTARGGPLTRELDWSNLMDPMKYVGRSVEQTERFIAEVIEPLREHYADRLDELGSSDRGV